MLAAKASLKTAQIATKVAVKGAKMSSQALQRAGIGNDELGSVIRGGEKVARGTAKAGRAVANTGKAAVKGAKATVKGAKVTVKIAKKATELAIKAVQLLIRFIQGVIALIKIVIATIAASEVLLIILLVLLVTALVATMGFLIIYLANNGEFNFGGGNNISGGDTTSGDNSSWVKCTDTMFDWYVDNMEFEMHGYSDSHGFIDCRYSVQTRRFTNKAKEDVPEYYPCSCDLLGDDVYVGAFCSGYVQACIAYAGIYEPKSGFDGKSDKKWTSFGWDGCGSACTYLKSVIDTGSTSNEFTTEVLKHFDLYTYSDYTSGKYKPQDGDIVIKSSHMEIYGGLTDKNTAIKKSWGESFYRDNMTCESYDSESYRFLAKGSYYDTGKSLDSYLQSYTYYLQYKGGSTSSSTEDASTEASTEEATTEASN